MLATDTRTDYFAWAADIGEPVEGEPHYEEHTFLWGAELDRAISELRHVDRRANSGFLAASVGGGAAVLPTQFPRADGTTRINPLLVLSRNGGDEDWVIVTRNWADADHFQFEEIARRLSPYRFETHISPMWRLYICCHS